MPVLHSKTSVGRAENAILWVDDYIVLRDQGLLSPFLEQRGYRTYVKKENVKILLEFGNLDDYLEEFAKNYDEGIKSLATQLNVSPAAVKDFALNLRSSLWTDLYSADVLQELVRIYPVQTPRTPKTFTMDKPTIQVNGVEQAGDDEKVKARKAAHQNFLGKIRPPPFAFNWKLYYDKDSEGSDYSKRFIDMTDISNIGNFYEFFNNFPMERVGLRDSLHLCHTKVKPMWEDPANHDGGALTFRVRKELAQDFFHQTALLVLGGQVDFELDNSDHVVVVSFSARINNCLVSVWHKRGGNEKSIEAMKKVIIDGLDEHLRPRDAKAYFYKRHSEHAGFEEAVNASTLTKIEEE